MRRRGGGWANVSIVSLKQGFKHNPEATVIEWFYFLRVVAMEP